jgi:hypothetical protein
MGQMECSQLSSAQNNRIRDQLLFKTGHFSKMAWLPGRRYGLYQGAVQGGFLSPSIQVGRSLRGAKQLELESFIRPGWV